MTATAPEFEPLGGATLSRKWILEVDTSATSTPTWTPVYGRSDFQPTTDATTQDSTDMDAGGYKSSTITALGWGATATLMRKTQAASATAYDPGQEALRLASLEMGAENRVHIRYYEWNGADGPKVEAYEGYASVAWSENSGGTDGLSTVAVTLTGQGARTAIPHPYPGV